MTCAECKEVIKRGFLRATVAERAAVGKHYWECDTCRAEIRAEGDPSQVTPERLAQMKLLVAARWAADQMDPEGR